MRLTINITPKLLNYQAYHVANPMSVRTPLGPVISVSEPLPLTGERNRFCAPSTDVVTTLATPCAAPRAGSEWWRVNSYFFDPAKSAVSTTSPSQKPTHDVGSNADSPACPLRATHPPRCPTALCGISHTTTMRLSTDRPRIWHQRK